MGGGQKKNTFEDLKKRVADWQWSEQLENDFKENNMFWKEIMCNRRANKRGDGKCCELANIVG